MRSTAPAAVAASMSCSRAWLGALRRQARAMPDVHMTIGRISATQSSRFRSAPRRRPPRHPRRAHADAGRKNAPGCHQPIVVHRRWRHPRTGRRRQRPRRRPAPVVMPCSPASWSPLEHVGRRSRSFPPDQDGVGVVRLTTAGEGRLEGLVPRSVPTVAGVTGTNPRYGNRSRQRTSRRSRR